MPDYQGRMFLCGLARVNSQLRVVLQELFYSLNYIRFIELHLSQPSFFPQFEHLLYLGVSPHQPHLIQHVFAILRPINLL